MKFEKIIPYICCLFFQLLISNTSTDPPTLNATGNQIYNPQTEINIATNFSITAGGSETGQLAVYFQISEGYDFDVDILKLKNPGSFPNIDDSDWDDVQGKLTLRHKTPGEVIPYSTIKNLVLDVIFNSADTNPLDDKKISISVGNANYLPSTDHYYEYVPSPGITWSNAKIAAESRTYYGLKGYLATLRTLEEAVLCGEQAQGAGWIGASDQSSEGTWEWVTGPEGIIPFWQGTGLNGSPINGEFNNWNSGNFEPNQAGNEDYAHITYNLGPGTLGKWNDLKNSGSSITTSPYYPQGYVVEFGGSIGDPILNITDYVELKIPRILSAATTNEVCGSGSATLNATTNSMPDPLNGVEVQWWDSLINGTLLATGNSFTTPNLNSSTIFYAVPVKNDGTTTYTSFAERTPYEVKVYDKPVLNTLPDVEQESNVFNLNNLKTDLSANSANERIEFYELGPTPGSLGTKIDPDNYIFSGSSTNNEKNIIAVATNLFSIGLAPPCNERTLIKLRVGACDIPTTFLSRNVPVCETSTDPLGGGQDGFETFDKTIFSDIEADLKVAEPLFNVFGTEITFYRSDAAATAGAVADRIDKTVDYTTSAGDGFVEYSDRWEQELWVRVENTTFSSACFDTKLVRKLIVNKLPKLRRLTLPFDQCNNPIFNLTNRENVLAFSHGSLTFNWKDSNGSSILNSKQYQIPGGALTETITVEIETNPTVGNACPSPTTISVDLAWFGRDTAPPNYTQKESHKVSTTGAVTGQGQNGIESFDATIFSDIITDLKLAEPSYVDKQFTFYGSERNAQDEDDVFDTTNYRTDPSKQGFSFNPIENRWEQEVWVYISNNITTTLGGQGIKCHGLYKVATLYIEKRPVFYDVADQELCDDTPDELDTYSVFDTSLLFGGFTINTGATLQQDPSLFDVQYSYIDDSGSAVVLDPNLPVNFNSNTQDITVTLTNKTTNSSSAPGQSEGIIKFRVYKQPVAYPSDPAVAGIFTIEDCDDIASGSDDDLETLFDITNIKEILLNDPSGTRPVQLSSDFDFVFTDGSGNPVTLTSDYRAKSGDQINVTITNPLSTLPSSCEETITIEFKVNPLPSYDMDNDTIVCLNPLPGQPVEIGTSNWFGGTDPLIYEYSWTFSGDPLFSENTPTIGVEKGGVYTVVVTDAVTRCTRTKTITVTESEMASLDRDDDGNVDLTEYNYFVEKTDLTDDNTNTITIKNIVDLGIGDYEFSIDDPFGPYKDDPTFENDVKPGVHTIYIRDKNSYYTYDYGCGIAQVDVSIIGYKKYFTPNGDGINETWKILGINSAFYAKSKVYIFDKYGKLLKELDPLSDGWDGTYLGKPMPATDYWFRTYLEDGREFKGHFSLVRGKF
jgi:gliding motility-associated-like protein